MSGPNWGKLVGVRYGIVEGEPGSMPWGQWHLMQWVGKHLRRRPRSDSPPTPPTPPQGAGEPAPAEPPPADSSPPEPGPYPH